MIINACSLIALQFFPDNHFDSIITDPPYELGFMGKSWDATGIAYNVQLWREALRVLKPGGHLLAFSGSRTYHRMTCAIEDAGFEVRDGNVEFPDAKGAVSSVNGWQRSHGIAYGEPSNTEVEYVARIDSDTSAARFFYCAKASKSDRDEGLEMFEEVRHADREKSDGVGGNNPRNRTNEARKNFHPTVKPTALMQYLCTLVTPPGGHILDPFAGSGSTGKAAKRSGFQFTGIERDPEYAAIAEARINT
jgi:DNA modification methylase